ncbi:MAG: hypothetical protein ACOYNS_14685 [Bacteroidota bacterium]
MSAVTVRKPCNNDSLSRVELDIREKELIMQRIFHSQVYKEFIQQWGTVLKQQEVNMR